jgi:hypothetical protein
VILKDFSLKMTLLGKVRELEGGVTVKVLLANWAPVAHACNSSYSGGKDQENHSSKSAQGNNLQDPISKILTQQRAGGVAQVVKHLPSKHETLSSNLTRVQKNFKILLA